MKSDQMWNNNEIVLLRSLRCHYWGLLCISGCNNISKRILLVEKSFQQQPLFFHFKFNICAIKYISTFSERRQLNRKPRNDFENPSFNNSQFLFSLPCKLTICRPSVSSYFLQAPHPTQLSTVYLISIITHEIFDLSDIGPRLLLI
ncbi:hypothetical protein FGO68_gene6606 [Halteria grandinella]|uniref:Uncharacterized protein n=1 Tax=Halteria grandinella TaxID=5974 RepID=A0A8J8SU64_HALGN|nr:hypothetical protein FGO68_gene6606 [Halteria grandinella]